MPVSLKRIASKFIIPVSADDRSLTKSIKLIVGERPYNLSLYRLAMIHSSTAETNHKGVKESNERLEYLGDAVLGLVVAEYLFIKYPFKDEGFLTEIRAKIVNREALNQVSRKIGLKDLIKYQKNNRALSPKSIFGDSLEALIGAIYLDKGYKSAKKFILKKLIQPHYDLENLINTISNYKSKIIEWAQKENKDLNFEVEEIVDDKQKKFKAIVIIDDKQYQTGFGLSKKKAEQDAARRTIDELQLFSNE